MSHNVRVRFDVTEGRPPWMHAADIVRIYEENEDLPESNFIEAQLKEAQVIVNSKIPCESCKTKNDSDARHCKKCGKALPTPPETATRVELKKLYWAGNHAHDSLRSVASFVHGRVEAFFVGEEDVFAGAIIEDGKYTPCDVEMTLVPEK
jgi:ribosomal protein L40E